MTHPTDDELEAMVAQTETVERDLSNGFPMTCERGRVFQQSAAMLRACKGGAHSLVQNCTIDLRGAGYLCVARDGDTMIGVYGEGDKVMCEGGVVFLDGLHILGPTAVRELRALEPAPDARQPIGLYSALTEDQKAAAMSFAESESFGPEECKNAPDSRQEGWRAGMTDREKVARGVWDTLMSDYTFDEAMAGEEQATHAEAIKWVFDVADAAIRALAEKGPTDD